MNQALRIGRCPAQPADRGGGVTVLKVTAAIIAAALASLAVWVWVQRLRPTDLLGVAYSASFADQRRMDVFVPGPNANGVCIVFLHGGGFVSGTRRNWASTARHFRDLGYTCACVDYRLAPTFQYPAAVQDARLAVSFLRARSGQYRFNPNEVAVVGSSAGGCLALTLGALRPDDALGLSAEMRVADTRPQALVLECPVSTFRHMDGQGWVSAYLGHKESASERLYRAASPIDQLHGGVTDALIVHGSQDGVIPFAQSEALDHRVRETGGCSELIRLQGVGHAFGGGVSTPAQRQTNDAIDRFLKRRFFLGL